MQVMSIKAIIRPAATVTPPMSNPPSGVGGCHFGAGCPPVQAILNPHLGVASLTDIEMDAAPGVRILPAPHLSSDVPRQGND